MGAARSTGVAVAVTIGVAAGTLRAQEPAARPAGPSAAQTHIGHVLTSWKDTPNKQGLLPVAAAEAELAAAHAALAAKSAGDLDALKRHAAHVLHALDPSIERQGPGAGYGVRMGAAGARQHVQLAAKMEGASKGVITHANHVATSLSNVLEWTEQAIGTAEKIRAATSVSTASALVPELVAQTTAITDGVDSNKDGSIGWQKGEGGLAQARAHMELMVKGEGG